MVKFQIINIGTISLNKFWGETKRLRQATATCALLTLEDGRRLLVDPSPTPDALVPMLYARSGLRPEQIDLVFVTHWHGDHHQGLEAFCDATWLMANSGIREWLVSSPVAEVEAMCCASAEDVLPDELALVHTPGHTLQHHSLAADTEWGRLLVAGDSVMTRDHLRTEEGHSNSLDFHLATTTIQAMKAHYDVVVPGHDNYLLVQRGA